MITEQEIEAALNGRTFKQAMINLLANPGQTVSESAANFILESDDKTAAILERLVSEGICRVQTNRWFPSQYQALRDALSSPEFKNTKPLVKFCKTGADIKMVDAKSGNVVFSAISAPTAAAIRQAVKIANKEMSDRKKETASRVEAEKQVNAE